MNDNDVTCIVMQSTAGALMAWVVIAFVIWQLFRFLRKRGGSSVAIATADADATASGGAAQAGVIVNVYLGADPRHGTKDEDGYHVSLPAAVESAAFPAMPVRSLPHQTDGHSGESVGTPVPAKVLRRR